MDQPKRPSGSLPPDDALYAPGLKWRARTGGDVPYWVPPQKDIAAGYRPKNLALDATAPAEALALKCRTQWADLLIWRAERNANRPTRHTISWLIDRFLFDDTSPFQRVAADTQKNYRFECAAIRAAIGKRSLEPRREGGNTVPAILGHDLLRWHREFGNPVELIEDGKPVLDGRGEPVMVASTPSRARHLISMVRGLLSYSVTIGTPGAAAQKHVIEQMEFPSTEARTRAPTYAQVDALVNKADEMGYRSIAITTLAQYEFIERRVSIIGKWERDRWIPGWIWEGVTPDWRITYYQRKRKVVLREFDLKIVQRLLGLMQETPKEARQGPIIRCEDTGLPWRKRYYAEKFREIARAAGVPDDVWSMDMRAGGGTEADDIAEITPRMLQDGFGHSDLATQEIYRRAKPRNAQKVVELRQRARGANDSGTQ